MNYINNQGLNSPGAVANNIDRYPPDTLISRAMAAQALGLSTTTLANWASKGLNTDVLKPLKLGPHTVRYSVDQVKAIQRLGIPGARDNLTHRLESLL